MPGTRTASPSHQDVFDSDDEGYSFVPDGRRRHALLTGALRLAVANCPERAIQVKAAAAAMKTGIVIIGGGAIGAAVAYYLRLLEPSTGVTVVERDPTFTRASTPRASGRLGPWRRRALARGWLVGPAQRADGIPQQGQVDGCAVPDRRGRRARPPREPRNQSEAQLRPADRRRPVCQRRWLVGQGHLLHGRCQGSDRAAPPVRALLRMPAAGPWQNCCWPASTRRSISAGSAGSGCSTEHACPSTESSDSKPSAKHRCNPHLAAGRVYGVTGPAVAFSGSAGAMSAGRLWTRGHDRAPGRRRSWCGPPGTSRS